MNIFIGKNDSGKTNILKAIHLLFSCGSKNNELDEVMKGSENYHQLSYMANLIDKRLFNNHENKLIEIKVFFKLDENEKKKG